MSKAVDKLMEDLFVKATDLSNRSQIEYMNYVLAHRNRAVERLLREIPGYDVEEEVILTRWYNTEQIQEAGSYVALKKIQPLGRIDSIKVRTLASETDKEDYRSRVTAQINSLESTTCSEIMKRIDFLKSIVKDTNNLLTDSNITDGILQKINTPEDLITKSLVSYVEFNNRGYTLSYSPGGIKKRKFNTYLKYSDLLKLEANQRDLEMIIPALGALEKIINRW